MAFVEIMKYAVRWSVAGILAMLSGIAIVEIPEQYGILCVTILVLYALAQLAKEDKRST